MFKVMIVDDEAIVRIGIKSCVSWAEHGFEIVGEAANGEEALEVFKRDRPDILITDIKMPLMDGIELIKAVGSMKCGTKLIVLSCLNEYEYVRRAMKYGAVDYLFKSTMSPQEILDICLEAKQRIMEERSLENEMQQLQQKAMQNTRYLREELLGKLVSGKIKGTDAVGELDKLGIALEDRLIVCLAIEWDNLSEIEEKFTDDSIKLVLDSGIHTVSEILRQYNTGTAFLYKKRMAALINIRMNSLKDRYQYINDIAHKIQKSIHDYTNLTVSIGISGTGDGFSSIRMLYEEANAAIEQRFYLGKGGVFHSREIDFISIDLEKELSGPLSMVFESARRGLDNKIHTDIENLFNLLKGLGYIRKEDVCKLALDIVVEFLRIYRDEPVLELFLGESHNMLQDVYRCETIVEVKEWVKGMACRLEMCITDKRGYTAAVTQAMEYIKSQYHEEITLEGTSKLVNMSKNYFCRLFKQETGMNFVKYLNTIRVEHAKRLLNEENIKVYEAAYRVGYKNYRYFNRVFKEIAGCNPYDIKKKDNIVNKNLNKGDISR